MLHFGVDLFTLFLLLIILIYRYFIMIHCPIFNAFILLTRIHLNYYDYYLIYFMISRSFLLLVILMAKWWKVSKIYIIIIKERPYIKYEWLINK
jgi:hypothetical protein